MSASNFASKEHPVTEADLQKLNVDTGILQELTHYGASLHFSTGPPLTIICYVYSGSDTEHPVAAEECLTIAFGRTPRCKQIENGFKLTLSLK